MKKTVIALLIGRYLFNAAHLNTGAIGIKTKDYTLTIKR